MDNSIPVWLLPLLSFIVGIVVALLAVRLMRNSSPASTENKLDDLQQRFDSYQDEVVAHFSTTAELVNKLTENYQNVQEHLLQSAERLALDESTRQRLLNSLVDTKVLEQPREEPANTTAPAEKTSNSPAQEEETQDTPQPPRDYANKAAGQVGTLDESFGLKKD